MFLSEIDRAQCRVNGSLRTGEGQLGSKNPRFLVHSQPSRTLQKSKADHGLNQGPFTPGDGDLKASKPIG
jgi:hypothetical protein